MKRERRIRLSRGHQRWIYASVGLLFVTGVLWLVAQSWLAGEDGFGMSTSPVVPWSMKLHGAAAMLALIVLGTLLPGHVRRAWNARRSRATGATVLALNGLLIVSGYALYYVGGETARAITSPLHWLTGLALPFVLICHLWRARRLRAPKSRNRTVRSRRRRGSTRVEDGVGVATPIALPAPGRRLHHSVLEP